MRYVLFVGYWDIIRMLKMVSCLKMTCIQFLKKNYREKRYSRPLQLYLKINTRQESNIGKVGSSVLRLKLLTLDIVLNLCVLITCQVHDLDFSFPTQSTASYHE